MSDRFRLLLARRFPAAVEARARRDYEITDNPDDAVLGDRLPELSRGHDALLVSGRERLDAGKLARIAPSVRVIATFSVGFDHIDVEAAAARGVVVTNTPDVLTESTADLTMLLLLGAARRAVEGLQIVRDGEWPARGGGLEFLLGMELAGRALGIIGMGRIGRSVARRAAAFGLRVLYHNRRRLPPELESEARYVDDLRSLLAASDVVSLHCPARPDGGPIMRATEFRAMRAGAVFVNTARGSLVDEDALLDALESGHLSGAGLDVYRDEPAIRPEFRRLPVVFALPHLGSATLDTRNAMGFRALDNIDAVLSGGAARDQLAPLRASAAS